MSEPVKEIQLPKTLKDLSSHFSFLDIVKQKNPFSDITKEQKLIWKYSVSGIAGGRSFDSVIIFLAGPSGAGKSATINALFDDDSLCRTNDATSETEKPSLVSKLLCVKGEQMPVKGNLGFVDVPGTFHTDRESESKNWAIVKKYRDNLPELGYRVFDKTLKALARGKKLRRVVYPNLVLFVVKADNRLQGSDSRLSVSLIALKIHENLVDTKASNLIIVLSHAYSVSPKPKYFNSDIEKMIKNIKEIVEHELGIKDVDVVPVENKPLKYLDEEDKQGDFFPLPNGQLSHGNLFDAMLNRFEANKDHLGKLLVGWYFNPECPERLSHADVIEYAEEATEQEIVYADKALESLNLHLGHNTFPVYNFQSLGHGFCPVMEQVKSENLFSLPFGEDGAVQMKEIQIGPCRYSVPTYFNESVGMESSFHRLSFYEKEEY